MDARGRYASSSYFRLKNRRYWARLSREFETCEYQNVKPYTAKEYAEGVGRVESLRWALE